MNTASMIRISFELGPWDSPDSEEWQALYDGLIDQLKARGHELYGVLEPGLAPWPLGEKLLGDDALEAEAWIDAYATHAASVIKRYADRIGAFEVLPQTRAACRPEWLAATLEAIRAQAGDAGQLVAGIPADPDEAAAFVDALITAGRQAQSWAPGEAPLDGLAVFTALSAGMPATAAQHTARFDGYRAAFAASGEPAPDIYVSGFTFDGGGDSFASQVTLTAARAAIDAHPAVRLAARASTEMAPVGLRPGTISMAPGRGDSGGNGGEAPPPDPNAPAPSAPARGPGADEDEAGGGLVIDAPAPSAPARGPNDREVSVPPVDGFDYPVGSDASEPWDSYKIDADLVDPGYKERFGAWHSGEDWNGMEGGDRDLGKPITAIANGLVVTAGYFRPSWGNVVLLRHDLPDGTQIWSQYAHLDELHVRAGEVVFRGRQLGTLGKGADNKWLAHLHFEIRATELPADNWFPMARDREAVLANYAVPKDFIAARRPGAFATGPSVIVDEKDAFEAGRGFTRSEVPNWHSADVGHGGGSLFTFASNGKEANIGTWQARLPKPGRYLVAAFVPSENSTTQNAIYRIMHASGRSTARVDQSAHAGAWVPLGSYRFDSRATVRLSDATGEPDALGRLIAFDALRFTQLEA